MADTKLDRALKVLASVQTAVGLIAGSIQFLRAQGVEAAKPYLQKKLEWCEDAVETASFIAVADPAARSDKTLRFWQLYWGRMALIENDKVTSAMEDFKTALLFDEASSAPHESSMLRSAAVRLAHACRQEMADSWSPIWWRWGGGARRR
jgi:hypothetical protein